jgi:chaperone BCS1
VGVFSSVVDEFRSRGHANLLINNPFVSTAAKLLVLGPVIETVRRIFQWLVERFRFKYSISARFVQGDPAFEWMTLFMTTERVWRRSRDFNVTARSSARKWAVNKGTATAIDSENADYVPLYEAPQLFRWNGYWLEVKDSQVNQPIVMYDAPRNPASLCITIYTLDMSVLSKLVEEARLRYIEASKPHVTIHSGDPNFGHLFTNVKQKPRRPLNTLILEDGVVDSLIEDVVDFLKMEDWYIEAGIPHRRGYLLHGPPGVGKTSTIYAVAGELGLEIYTLSLASSAVDDGFILRAMSSIPKRSIVLIEDIDCAFLPREELKGPQFTPLPLWNPSPVYPPGINPNCRITLSGLLNMLDGVGSEEGKIFFATTNHIERLDPALLRPGRIDRKIQYKLATKCQALALFERFFPHSRFGHLMTNGQNGHDETLEATTKSRSSNNNSQSQLAHLAEKFASGVPDDEFSTAQLQGYLLMYKTRPWDAASDIEEWVESERAAAREKEAEAQAKINMAVGATPAKPEQNYFAPGLTNGHHPNTEKVAN